MKLFCTVNPDGSVVLTPIGRNTIERVRQDVPPGSFLIDASQKPESREHRDAWVWNGERIVVDESRIKPKPATRPAPSGAAPAYDPRVDQIGPELAQQMAAAFEAMRRELLAEIAIEHQRSIESLTVHSALAEGRKIAPGSFPALERMVTDGGQPVTADAIVAAADMHAARIHQIAAERT